MAITASPDLARGTPPRIFLDSLSRSMRDALLEDADAVTAPAGTMVFAASDRSGHVGVVADGLVRIFLATTDGRRVTMRYARGGSLIGTYGVVDPRAPLSVEAITDCEVLSLAPGRLQGLVRANGEFGLLLVSELGRLLHDSYSLVAANTLGTLVERVAGHLLELAVIVRGDRLVAPVTQQTLAECVGTAREAIGRVLRDLRADGLVATGVGEIELVDPVRLAAIVGRWQAAIWP